MGYVVNQNIEAVEVDIVNRKGSLIRRVRILGNDYVRLKPGEFYLTTYENYRDGSPPIIGQVLCNGTNYILFN